MEWWDCSSEPEGSTLHMCSFRAWAHVLSYLLLLFLQAQWYHFYLQDPQRAVSHSGESGKAVEARVGKAGCGQHSLPAALQTVPSLGTYTSHPCTHPREDPGGSWQKPSGWRKNIALSYVASLPCEEEGAAQIPALTILAGCAIPQRLWHEGSQRDQTTFLTVTSNKSSLQPVVSLNHKGQNVSCTCWGRCYLNPQLHAHTFAVTDYRYIQTGSVSSLWRATKVTLWVKELDHPPPLLSFRASKEASLTVITPNKNLVYSFQIVRTYFVKVMRWSKSTCSNIHTIWLKRQWFKR